MPHRATLIPPAARPAPAQLSSLNDELQRQILWLITGRAVIVFLGLNLAGAIEILPLRIGVFPFASFLNVFIIVLTGVYLLLWRNGWNLRIQIYLQFAGDLLLTTILVACTRGIESPFVSFYLLIIIYSSLTLGRNGAIISSASGAILYSGLITANQLGIVPSGGRRIEMEALTFRLSLHALGFFSVAFLGTYLSMRLHAVQEELEEKTDSVRQLRRMNERIVSCIRSGLITADLQGKITMFNSAAEEITERRRPEVLQTQVQAIVGDELWSRILGSDLMKDLRPLRHESWLDMPGGSKIFLGFSVSPLMEQGGELLG
jgi:PAS domain-containing protein